MVRYLTAVQMFSSCKKLTLIATLLHQTVCSSGFVLPNKLSMMDYKLPMSESLESDIPQDLGVKEGSHDELMYSLGVNLARYVVRCGE